MLEAAGDVQGAGRAYRRAVDLDPTYPPACLALARRAAATGDLGAGHARARPMRSRPPSTNGRADAALTLQRSRARFLVTWGELALAAQAFRTLLERAPDSIEDRLAYADLLGRSEQTISMAFGEIERVLSVLPRDGQAYRQLAQLYVRVGQPARAVRVYALMGLMGILEGGDRPPAVAPVPRRGVLSDELRAQCIGPAARGALTEALAAVREPLEQSYPFAPPSDAVPLPQMGDPTLRAVVQDLERVFGVAAEVYVAPSLPVAFVLSDQPKPAIYLSQGASQLPDAERRVLLGNALEALRGGYALITRLAEHARLEVSNLLDQLVRPESERSAEAQSYIKALPRKATKALEKLWGVKRSTIPPLAGGASQSMPQRLGAVPVQQWLSDARACDASRRPRRVGRSGRLLTPTSARGAGAR